jgi:asparagine synthase (glutamine-hydrolysing)
MTAKEKNIQKKINLDEIPGAECQVIGISNLNHRKDIGKNEIVRSRGEFAGYFCDGMEVVLFRDRLGARNLYYSIDSSSLLISNDLGWLAKSIKTEPNWHYILTDYLQFQIPFSEETFFAGIRKVMPGEFVYISKEKVKREKYWKPEFGNESFDPKHLLGLTKDAVEYRLGLIGESHFTSYLSGGIDSSTVTLLSKPDRCFSGFYEEEGYSEMDYIEAVVSNASYPIRYIPVEITEKSFQKQLVRFPNILPDPCAGLGVIPQVLVAQEAAKQGYEYAFTGEGGDETFLGYNWNTVLITLADSARGLLRDKYMIRYEPMVEKVLRDGFAALTGGLLARGNDKVYAIQRILDIWDYDESVENNIIKINLTVGLPAILTVDEQVGLYVGVEPISPLIDHHIIEYVCSVMPQSRAPIPKFMLREALVDVLPEKVRLRYDKMGFPVPYTKWNWKMLKPVIKSLASRKKLEIDVSKYTTMDRETWALYSIETWCQYYFESQMNKEMMK